VRAVILGVLAVVAALLPSNNVFAALNPCGPPVQSVIACENSQPGDPESDWQVTLAGDASIQGFATAMSVNVGETEFFKISTPSTNYHLDILRLGYYQGNGARKIAANVRPTASLPQTQPACLTDTSTGLIDCGNWGVSASWTVPTTAVSGVYLAHLVRDDNGQESLIPFVVRNDASHSDIVFQTSDETWQAYNTYGNNSLYQCSAFCPPGPTPRGYQAAFKVSYNRPWHSAADDNGASWFLYAEYPMIRFLESNGYDVSYMSGIDVATRGSLLLNHKAYMSTGHDEYWTGPQRSNVEAARAAGVSLAFFSGNEMFWKTRLEQSIDSSHTANRTLVTYKETHFDTPVDPQDPPVWTGTWRDPRFSPPSDGGRPENAVTGQMFIVNSGTTDISVPAAYAKLRFWRNTAVANLTSGSVTLGPGTGTLGYEWDEDVDNGARPPGIVQLSQTSSTTAEVFTDYGTTVQSPMPATHHLTLYKAGSALVFGAGTVQWAWGLDADNPSHKAADKNMQQAMVNLFADMGVQPYSLISGLVAASASTDTTAPTTTITSPAAGANFSDGAKVTISGTAVDSGGGVVGGVEVSTDGGANWHPATGTTSWTYSWVVHGSPASTLMARSVDDSGNLSAPASISVNVACPCSVWGTNVTPGSADGGDSGAIEVGMKFRSDTAGTVNGIRFYKSSKNTGTHIGNLWSATGTNLARVTFTGESASGWQQANFSPAVNISANTTYIVSYFAPAGHYAQDDGYMFNSPSPEPDGHDSIDSAPLHALRNTGGVTNDVYTYTSSTKFPTSTFDGENYWVDVVFTPSGPPTAPGQATGVVASAGNTAASLAWNAPSTGDPATSYTITPYIGSTAQATTVVTGTPAPITAVVSGLTNGTAYTFTVTGANGVGSGPESAPSNSVTPSANASLVANGGFESGIALWTAGGVAPPTASSTTVHSGSGSVLLGAATGAEPSGDSTLSQTIAVPSGGTSTLTFWYWPSTTDELCTGSACQYDWQEAQIRNTGGATLASVLKLNSNARTWTPVTFSLAPYAGQTIVLWFNVHEDGASPPDDTSMFVDDVSITGSQPTVPGAPTGVSATAGNAQATVSWTAPSNGGSAITGYTITPYIGGVAQAPSSAGASATSATLTGLTNGTAYTFTVAAINAIGTGPASAQSNVVTPTAPTAPGAPTNVVATAGDSQASLTWTAPSSNGGSAITGYVVTPYIAGVAQAAIPTGSTATSYTVPSLTNGTTYTFTVAATNAIGTGSQSAQSNAVTPTGPTAPGAPTNVVATAGNAQASLTWTAPSSNGGSAITGYVVTPYIAGVAQAAIPTGSTATSYTVPSLTNGTAYTFTVAATNAIGTGSQSAQSNAVTPTAPTVPGAPTSVVATAGNASASLTWTAPSSNGGSAITGYTVTPYIAGVAQAPQFTGTATNTTVTGLTNGTAYSFTVAASNAVGTGPASAQSNVVTPSAAPTPTFVQSITAHGLNKATLTVTPTANITAGNRIIVEVGVWNDAHSTTTSVTDSAGNTYTEVAHFAAADGTEQSIWTAPITAGGGTKPVITARPAATADVGISAVEYSGLSTLAGTAAVDVSKTNVGITTSAATVSSGATPATTAAGELALGFYADSGFGNTATAASGWTMRARIAAVSDMDMLIEDQIVGSGATPNASVSTGANTDWLVSTVVFKHG
jgi:hypothetical protein